MSIRIDRIVCGPIEANAYFVRPEGSSEAVLIDPGDHLIGLLEASLSLGVRVSAIIVTHGHFDHLLSAAHLSREWNAPVYISKEDAPALTDKRASLCPERTKTPYEPVQDIRLLPDEGEWSAAGLTFEIIKTPGHTKGGVCLYLKDENIIFTGDTLFDDSFGRTDLPGGDMNELVQSLRMLLNLPGDTMVYSGHGDEAAVSDIRKVFRP